MAPRAGVLLFYALPITILILVTFSFSHDDPAPSGASSCSIYTHCSGHAKHAYHSGSKCICECREAFTGADCRNCTDPTATYPACTKHREGQKPKAEPVKPSGQKEGTSLLTAKEVLDEFPFLTYAKAGEEACDKANEAWREKVAKAYPDDSDEEIVGREGLHLFFTTDCTRHSLWQAMALERSWEQVNHPGALTRIVSGCYSQSGVPDERAHLLSRTVVDHPRAFIFFGPRVGGAVPPRSGTCTEEAGVWYEGDFIAEHEAADTKECGQLCFQNVKCRFFNYRTDKKCHLFSSRDTKHTHGDHVAGECELPKDHAAEIRRYQMPTYLATYSPINRPATAMYWLTKAKPRERVLALLDPDMVFMRPLLYHIEGKHVVEQGRPVGQFYDYLVSQSWNQYYDTVCNDTVNCKPLGNLRDFAPGPPHFMHRSDWQQLAPYWLKFTVKVKKLWEAWTSEMAGMSIGLARLGLRSRLVEDGMWDRSFMATDALDKHGWPKSSKDLVWRHCAEEGETCFLPFGRFTVRYTGGTAEKYKEKQYVKGGEKFLCTHDEGGYFSAEGDPDPENAKSCLFIRTYSHLNESQISSSEREPPPTLMDYVPSKVLPSLLHYCFTLEVNRKAWPESVWHFARGQIEWEKNNNRPLLEYQHWSKYRSLTDWSAGPRVPTLLECKQPLLFHFPPLPYMEQKHSFTKDDRGWQVFFAGVIPLINDAVTAYRMKYCPDGFDRRRIVRTAHDSYYLTPFETIVNISAPEWFTIIKS